ncbi:MAG: ornithine cyclodeaminase family protein [Anaerolineae bacterium]|nr:MAG: ornithine cyclodeaminase family protein [Anaerolineae bacterium]
MYFLNADQVQQALPMTEAIQAVKRAYAAVSAHKAVMPLRTQVPVAPHEGTTLLMPAYLQSEDGEALSIKIVSVFQKNPQRGLPLIYGVVLVLDPQTGEPQALLDGGALTAIRTGAASGAATDLLARPDCTTAAIFGAGVQGRTQLEAVCTVRPLRTVWVVDPNPEKVERFIQEMAGKGPIPTDLRPAEHPDRAAAQADIICAATTSNTPVFSADAIRPGTHINGVGSYTPQMREIPPDLLPRAAVFVDQIEAVREEAGEIIAALQEGLIAPDSLTEIGAVINNTAPGRTSAEQITFFKSVGLAAQDAAAAQAALRNADTIGAVS